MLRYKQIFFGLYIKERQNTLNIKKVWKNLIVSWAGYYKYVSHKSSAGDIENQVFCEEIKKRFKEHRGRYGSLCIVKILENQGLNVNRKCVSHFMRLMGLCPMLLENYWAVAVMVINHAWLRNIVWYMERFNTAMSVKNIHEKNISTLMNMTLLSRIGAKKQI